MQNLIDILHKGGFSCVISNSEIRTFSNRGIADIYNLYQSEPKFLAGASIADKIIGKAAAALLIAGGIERLYTDIISEPALTLLLENNVEVEFSKMVPYIENRDKSGWCPMESAVYDKELAEIIPIIDNFIHKMKKAG